MYILAWGLCGIFFVTFRAETQHPLCEKMAGHWIGEGTLMGGPASFRMEWEPVLEGQFFKLTFENQRHGSSASFKAVAFYHIINDSFTGTWFDIRGWTLPLTGHLTDSTWTTEWGDAKTEVGRTEYHFDHAGRIRVTDWILKKNEWRIFGTAVYKRKE